jgi:hypothetical protein
LNSLNGFQEIKNELPRGLPRGIKVRNPQEPRGKLQGIRHPALGLPAEGRRKRDKKKEQPAVAATLVSPRLPRFPRFAGAGAGTGTRAGATAHVPVIFRNMRARRGQAFLLTGRRKKVMVSLRATEGSEAISIFTLENRDRFVAYVPRDDKPGLFQHPVKNDPMQIM